MSVLVIKDKAEDLITNLIILQTNTTMGRDSAANLQVFTEQMLLLLQFDQSEREREFELSLLKFSRLTFSIHRYKIYAIISPYGEREAEGCRAFISQFIRSRFIGLVTAQSRPAVICN